ncbi:DMT family transporter [Algirhabdus cladophorae]|uniref:DMT family transporter n=1 Tax=Algirhabdus cladophorae TaxID=3377108 RepID=UPI003B845FDA
MRLFLLTVLALVALAANSVLNRLALTTGGIDPASLAVIRVGAGAVSLMILVAVQQGVQAITPQRSFWGPASLVAYMLGFSFAYVSLDTGVGALILFGVVQITMFAGALWMGEAVTAKRWIGAGIAFIGLVALLWPATATAPDLLGSALMAFAGLGWGLYSLLGKASTNPVRNTMSNFIWALPVTALGLLVVQDITLSPQGIALAALSGSVTSGMGYALWYALLPRLLPSVAAVSQLSVPVIAALGGVIFVAEPMTAQFIAACVLVLGGVALSVVNVKRASPD